MDADREQLIDRLRQMQRMGFIALPSAASIPPVGMDIEPVSSGCLIDREVARDPAPQPQSWPQAKALTEPPSKAEILRAIAAEIAACRACGLCNTRTKTVPGEGSPNAEIVFVGEGPGYHEDQQGRPFVGPAGDLLDKMIQAMHFRRDDVHILNVVKCRPPDNRNPEPDEIRACEHFLLRQIEAIKPRFLVTLGKFATQTLLATQEPISRLRGHWREYHGIPLMPTFHPAYLLRNPGEKRNCWEDLQKVMAEYERVTGNCRDDFAQPRGPIARTDGPVTK